MNIGPTPCSRTHSVYICIMCVFTFVNLLPNIWKSCDYIIATYNLLYIYFCGCIRGGREGATYCMLGQIIISRGDANQSILPTTLAPYPNKLPLKVDVLFFAWNSWITWNTHEFQWLMKETAYSFLEGFHTQQKSDK